VTKFILHLARGAEIKNLFKVDATVTNTDADHINVSLNSSAIFSNYISLSGILDKLPRKKSIVIDLSKCKLVDHSVMEHLSHFDREYTHEGGTFEIVGLHSHKRGSAHPLASAQLKA
jgi:MFS superfamily sulfate permease-like transporter